MGSATSASTPSPTRASSTRPTRSSASRRPASAAPTCTSTRSSARSWARATSSATSRWASSRRSASEVTHIAKGDRVVIPFNISCGSCFMCDHGLQSQCETTQVTRPGHGRRAVRLHEALRPGPRRAGRVPARAAGAVRPDQGARGAAATIASSTSPTSCRPPGRRSSTRTSRRAGRSRCSASARSATCARAIAKHKGAARDRHRPRPGADHPRAGERDRGARHSPTRTTSARRCAG